MWNKWQQACADARGEKHLLGLETKLQELEGQLDSERQRREFAVADLLGSQVKFEEFDQILEAERAQRAAAVQRCEQLERSVQELERLLTVERHEHQVSDERLSQLGQRLATEGHEYEAARAEWLQERERLEELLETERRGRSSLARELKQREQDELVAEVGAASDRTRSSSAQSLGCSEQGALAMERRRSAKAIAHAVADTRDSWARCQELERRVDALQLEHRASRERCEELEAILQAETREHKAVIAEALASQVQLQELGKRVAAEVRDREEACRALAEERWQRQALAEQCQELGRLREVERGTTHRPASQRQHHARGQCEQPDRQLASEPQAHPAVVERALRDRRPLHVERRNELTRSGVSPRRGLQIPLQGREEASSARVALPTSATKAQQAFDASVPLCCSGGSPEGGAAAGGREDSVRRRLDYTPTLSARSDAVSESPSFNGDVNAAVAATPPPDGSNKPPPAALLLW